MAVSWDALLKIKAQVDGKGVVDSMAAGLGRLGDQAKTASQGFKGLVGSMGGLVGGLQLLTPLATGAGLLGLASNSMKAAEGMYDLAQRTGVTVEALSRFKRPAALAGADIESVAKSLQKLSKGIVSGKGGAVDALWALGISTEDAAGKLRSADEILLDVAAAFEKMPDGIEKTAYAQQLFGKSGAELIPMLNEGRAALSQYKGITTDYAKTADEAGDAMIKLQGSVAAIGGQIAKVLLPFLIPATDTLTGMVKAFSALPGPLQVAAGGIATLIIAWGPLAGLLTTTITLGQTLATLQIGATVAGWAGAVGPAVVSMQAAIAGFLAFLTTTALPALVAFFSGPVGWTVLAVAAVVTMCIAFRKPLGEFIGWAGEQFGALARGFISWAVTPIQDAWNGLMQALPRAMGALGDGIAQVWTGITGTIRGALNAVIDMTNSVVARVVSAVNQMSEAVNSVSGRLGIPAIPRMMAPQIPRFATGGYVTRPTLAQIGEGGEPEYVVPASKAGAFAMNIAGGVRGNAAVQQKPTNWRAVALETLIANPNRYMGAANAILTGWRKQGLRWTGADEPMLKRRALESLGFGLRGGADWGGGGFTLDRRPSLANMRRELEGIRARESGGGGGGGITLNTRVDRVVRQDGEDRVTLAQAQALASDAARQAVAQMDRNLRTLSYRQSRSLRGG